MRHSGDPLRIVKPLLWLNLSSPALRYFTGGHEIEKFLGTWFQLVLISTETQNLVPRYDAVWTALEIDVAVKTQYECRLLELEQTRERAAIAQSVKRLVAGWSFRGSNPGWGEIFRTRPERPCVPPILYKWYRFFPWSEFAGCGLDHQPISSAEVKE